ncbi:hypothetical protein HYC85_016809 [Camellia sinensis]|uniref:Uncharacterized protein n=1 Tax=Camellia sinensis TaxID=4442 RepID=A0A7J7H2V9_CAMSI|nr:hypothetical protein HYC85_016809 [Camellia sinensis]
MSDQEAEMDNKTYLDDTEEDGGLESSGSALNRLAMLRLNPPVSSCRACGGSMKRRSPSSSSSSLQEPKSKKISRHPSSTLIVGDHLLQGFTKLHLPIPTLHRCVSDPINSPGTTNTNNPTNTNGFVNPLSSQNAKTPSPPPPPPPNAKPTSSASATLRRSLSDPIPTPTPPPDSIQCLTPNSKRLKRMRDRMKEMSQWWDEVMEGEKERGSEDDNNNGAPEKLQDESETTECEEAVSVERSGKWLIVHIKCSCGKGYQILLYGNICYYKLM